MWNKTGTEFWDDLANVGLSDAAARTHGEAVSWVYRVERDDLCIPKQLVRRFAGSPVWESAVAELVAKGLWEETADTYRVVHHADVIRASMVAQYKHRERDKKSQRNYRDRKREAQVARDVSDDVSDDADSQTVNTSQEVDESKNQTEYVLCRRCGEVQTREVGGVCRGCLRQA